MLLILLNVRIPYIVDIGVLAKFNFKTGEFDVKKHNKENNIDELIIAFHGLD